MCPKTRIARQENLLPCPCIFHYDSPLTTVLASVFRTGTMMTTHLPPRAKYVPEESEENEILSRLYAKAPELIPPVFHRPHCRSR